MRTSSFQIRPHISGFSAHRLLITLQNTIIGRKEKKEGVALYIVDIRIVVLYFSLLKESVYKEYAE